jgi:hypothetical protein
LKPYAVFIVIINGGFKMKRTIVFSILALCAITLVSAHGNNRRRPDFPEGPHPSWERGRDNYRNSAPAPEEITISGNLTIAQGMIALIDKDTTYLIMGLNRHVGFIDGLKEGSAVTLQGYARPDPRDKNVKIMHVQKMSLNGKEYELAWPYWNGNQNRQYDRRHDHRGRR